MRLQCVSVPLIVLRQELLQEVNDVCLKPPPFFFPSPFELRSDFLRGRREITAATGAAHYPPSRNSGILVVIVLYARSNASRLCVNMSNRWPSCTANC